LPDPTISQDHGIDNVTALHATPRGNLEVAAGAVQIHADMADQETSTPGTNPVKGVVGRRD